MTQLLAPFNARNFDPSQTEGQLPIGRHKVIVYSSEIKSNKANDGGYLELHLKVIEGEQTGATGAMRFNIYSTKSVEAVEIANRKLSAVCYVLSTFDITNAEQLYNKPFIVDVVKQTSDSKYTEVKKVYDIEGNEPGKTKAAMPSAAQPNAAQPTQPNNSFVSPAIPPAQGFDQPNQAFGQPANNNAPPWSTPVSQQASFEPQRINNPTPNWKNYNNN